MLVNQLLVVITTLICYQLVFCTGETVQTYSLAKGWNVTNENGSINYTDVQIPNGVYSLVNKSGVGDVLLSYNDVNLRWVGMEDWTWRTEFDSPDSHTSRNFVNLTFLGIDTISTIKLNGEFLAETNNMFVRYSFNIKDRLLTGKRNQLEITIKSPVREAKRLALIYPETPPECPDPRYKGECHMNFLRKMQASFSWDWGLAAPSLGLWKTVQLEVHDVAIIRDIDVATILDGKTWKMHIRVFLETGLRQPFYGDLTMYPVDLDDPVKITFTDTPVDYRNPMIEFEHNISRDTVKRWWPNGYGDQKLYHLHFAWNGRLTNVSDPKLWSISQKSIRIGFRTIELVQKDLPDGNSFLFKVNGIEMFMKGSNWIPSHILPEKSNDNDQVNYLLKAAKDANMNMLRVWGGGIYETDYFYDMADYYGILIWQDMMFACAMYPVFDDFLKSVEVETIQNALRLAHHPSIAIWATNNENEVALVQNWYKTASDYDYFANSYRQLYVATINHVLRTVIYGGRPDPLISSPSNGIQSVAENYIAKNPQDNRYGDIHYYDYQFDGWNPALYKNPRFASEYGFQSIPTMTSWLSVMGDDDNLTDLLEHRQHLPFGNAPMINLIKKHFNLPDVSDSDYLPALIYLSQVSQAMVVKVETEHYMSQRNTSAYTMGALYWQLNDVWVAPSWSSIDFRGTFKILQYWAKEFMAPLSIIAQTDVLNKVNVYVSRDTVDDAIQNLTVAMNIMSWSELLPKKTISWNFQMQPNSAQKVQSFEFDDYLTGLYSSKKHFLQFELHNPEGAVVSKTHLFPTNLKNIAGLMDPDITVSIASQTCDGSIVSVSLWVKVRNPALFVYLELKKQNVRRPYFSKNGFIQTIPIESVRLEYAATSCSPFKLDDLQVTHANKYLI